MPPPTVRVFETHISSPAPNASVTGPAMGDPIVVKGTLEAYDSQLTTVREPEIDTRVTVTLTRAAETIVVEATTDSQGAWQASFVTRTSGPATIKASYAGPYGGSRDEIDAEVALVVAPIARQAITVQLDGVAAAGASFTVPPMGRTLDVSISTTSPTRYVEIQSSLDNYQSTRRLAPPVTAYPQPRVWTSTLVVPGGRAPGGPVLLVRDVDFFDTPTETDFSFWTTDSTPPAIAIHEPLEDQVFVFDTLPRTITVRGTVDDAQSGFQSGSLTLAFAGNPAVPVATAGGAWASEVVVTSLGAYEVTLNARDNAGNTRATPAAVHFDVVSAYAPKTIEGLLSPAAYLKELLRFSASHLLTGPGGAPVNPDVLTGAFAQPFGPLAQSVLPAAGHADVDLLAPVQILRATSSDAPRFAGVAEVDTAGLIARWTFNQLDDAVSLIDEGRLGFGGGLRPGVAFGAAGSEWEGALRLDAGGSATARGPEVGADNRDFSVSFWIFATGRGQPQGPWRSILYKGREASGAHPGNRTFGLWLYPDSNAIHFRISTSANANDGGDSTREVPVNRWTHVAYVKAGSRLRLFLDGVLDRDVELSAGVVGNAAPLFIGANPYFSGYDGALSDLRIYATALGGEDVGELAGSRRTAAARASQSLQDYHRAAYEALLRGLGTSYEELRLLTTLSAGARAALAARLMLATPGEAGDRLDSLLPPPLFAFGGSDLESWLEGTFGLPSTIPTEAPTRLPAPWVLALRREWLAFEWEAAPSGRGRAAAPLLDPDLVDPEDLSPAAGEWLALLKQRRSRMDQKHAALAAAASLEDAMKAAFSEDEIKRFLRLQVREQAGYPIGRDLQQLSLTFPMYRRLNGYRMLRASLSLSEKDDAAHLLTQVWKVRQMYPVWQAAEAAMPTRLWPSLQGAAAWQPGRYKRSFAPWRGTTQARTEIESLLSGRIRDWLALDEDQARMVAAAQRETLPRLRDDLLDMAGLPAAGARLDELTERWLVDFAATGATSLDAIDQATVSLQSLINGVRTRRFESEHPAHAWAIKPDPIASHFDEEWQWLGTYGTWRSAVMNYLYPDNVLYPELNAGLSAAFKTFLKELRRLQPLTSAKLATPATPFATALAALSGDERTYFAPAAVALAFQRARLFTQALDWYRRVYDTSRPPAVRKLADKLRNENDNRAPSPRFDGQWTLKLADPHQVAATPVFGNPYTRYTLMQIVYCLLSQAEMEFAAGTLDARAHALALYLEAKEILAFPELRDLEPANPSQAYLPNPILATQRAQVDVALRKLRRGLSFLGTPLPPDPTRGAQGAAVSTLVRPTPYRFRVLMERAKQLVAQAQQIEQQYLSALAAADAEREKYMRESFALEIVGQAVALRKLYETDAAHGQELARRQMASSEIRRDRYRAWMAAGPNEHEEHQIGSLWSANTARNAIAGIDAAITGAQAVMSAASLDSAIFSGGAKQALAGGLVAAAVARGVAQGFLNSDETNAQVSAILASQDRRRDEWALQQNLASQDVAIGHQQITLAQDRVDIARQESLIALTEQDHARQMVAFLTNKFTSVEFYEWLQGVLADVYAFFLQISTSTAQQAELQLAFERQEPLGGLIKSDYWTAAAEPESTAGAGSARDRRGISGSARLLQDIYSLDQQAFSSERRLLNLGQTFSLMRMMPIEFQAFRRTGVLAFATPLQLFDEGFPGHYMRLIKRVRLSVAALVPPTVGIRATLTNSGLSRVVTGGPAYQTLVVRQDPQSVALTSASASTGVFELDMQADLLFPFEGNGVDTTWFLELPPAGNLFDFDTIFDAVMTIEYTALHSADLRTRVVKQQSRKWSGDRAFSVRRDLPDVWYEMANLAAVAAPTVSLRLGARDLPPGLSDFAVDEIVVAVMRKDGSETKFAVRPGRRAVGQPAWTDGPIVPAVKGLISTRHAGASGWRGALLGPGGADAEWRFVFSDADTSGWSLAAALGDGAIDEILVAFTLSGLKPAWS